MEEKQIKKLQKLLSAMDENSMTQEEFFKAFEKVMTVFTAMKEANLKQMASMGEQHQKAMRELESKMSTMASEVADMFKSKNEQEMASMEKKMKSMMTDCMDMMEKMKEKMEEVKDGKDADEQRIIEEISKTIPKKEDILNDVEKDLPKFGTVFRDGLELIQEESEKLKIEAIGYLRKELDELKRLIGTRNFGGGGGFSVGALNLHLIDDETPTGTVNGSNTDFTLANIPSPTSSLKVFVNGQRMRITEDYTFSGTTITFLIAPPTGSIILVDYRA